MKSASTAAINTLQREYAVRAKPRLYAEWEYNRFTTPAVAVTPAQNGDAEWLAVFGDANTIALPNRPQTGIAHARPSAVVRPLSIYRDTPDQARFYPAGPNDTYNYWASVQRTGSTITGGAYEFATPIEITVTYPTAVAANKLAVGFETSYAAPVSMTIEVSVDGASWSTAGINPILEAGGTITLWSGETWSTTPVYDAPVVIKAVRLRVYSMNKPNATLDVLQLGARLENDLSEFLVSYTTHMEVSERSFIAPLGRASSNQATITLSNIDGRFNNYNDESLYYGMIDKKVRFVLDLGIETIAQGGAGYEYTREFTGWTDAWTGQERTNVDVEIKDSSVFLQEMDMPVVFFEETAAGAVLWQVMDRIGMTNYNYVLSTLDQGQKIPFYWPETGKTVWEEFSNVAEATQMAVYFDEFDVLQIKARKAMYSDKAVDWNLDAIQNGQKLPDVIQTSASYDLEANQVDVVYKPAAYSDFNNGLPKMETVWEPEEDTVTLRSAPLTKNLTTAGTDLWITQSEAVFWQYESLVNIRGEIMRYKGKEYAYYNAAGAIQKQVIFSLEEKTNLDKLNPTFSFKNTFTGKLKVTERQLMGSALSDHLVTTNTYSSKITNLGNSLSYSWTGGISQQDGFVRQTNNGNQDTLLHLRHHESVVTGSNTSWYGMRFRFPLATEPSRNANWKIGGLQIGGDVGDGGYYIELTATSQIDGWEQRAYRNEVWLYSMPTNAGYIKIPATNGDAKGYPFAIADNVWYDLDVKYFKSPTTNIVTIMVYINGVIVGQWGIVPAKQPTNNGFFGTFVRGSSTMDIGYLYGLIRDESDSRDPDKTNFLDLRSGGYVSGFIEKEVKYNFRNITPKNYPSQRINSSSFVFDEYGPVVHELREFDVQFKEENRPVAHSNIYLTNSGQAEIVYYEADAFGARFLLANASRNNVIIKGEDTITFGSDNSVNQSLFIYGRSVYQEEDKTITKTDDASIRRRGPTKTEFNSRYIQTDDMANALSDWIIELWATGVDEVTVDTFGNPFLQLGDIVTINYPIKDMFPATHKYFIVSIEKSFETGYKTTYILRRARF